MGLPWEDFLEGAASVNAPLVNDELGKPENLRNHPAWALANWCFELSRHDYSQLIFFTYIPSWASFGQWFGQLWAESLGKNGKGTMPLPAVGVTDQPLAPADVPRRPRRPRAASSCTART